MRQGEGTASRRRIGPLFAGLNGVAVTGEDFSGDGEVEVSVNGSDWSTPAGIVGEIGDGYYYYQAAASEVAQRGHITVKLTGVCDEFTLSKSIDPAPQGIPVSTTESFDRHIGPLLALDAATGDAVTGEDFSGAGELEVSVNGAAWTSASGSVVEMSDGYYDYVPALSELTEVGFLAVKIAGVCQEFTISTEIASRPGVTTGVATAESIRDRIYTLLEALTPTSLAKPRFLRFRNEESASFDEWAEKNVAAALRRFQVREVGDDELPETSSGIEERIRVRFEIRIAYPQNHRYGAANAMDRDDVMNQDWKAINYAIGLYGGGNFSGDYDAIPLGATKTRESGGKVDYLVVMADFEYLRSIQ